MSKRERVPNDRTLEDTAAPEPETRIERETREITEIAAVLLRDKPPGTTVTEVWTEALDIWRIQFVLGQLH